MNTETIELLRIRGDGGTQIRASINPEVVREYKEEMEAGAIFPPVHLFYDGIDYWPGDGFHRIEATTQAGRTHISAVVVAGTRRDAILHAVAANSNHGLRRSPADKRRAVNALLADEEWGKWSDREIARRCKVSHTFVANLRPVLTGNVASENGRVYTTRHGTEAAMEMPAYVPVWQLQRAITDWLLSRSLATPGERLAVLLDLKDGAAITWDMMTPALPTPSRKRDLIQAINNLIDINRQDIARQQDRATEAAVPDSEQPQTREPILRQACNNVLDQLRQKQAAATLKEETAVPNGEQTEKHSSFECPHCKQKLVIFTSIRGSYTCKNCGSQWPDREAFFRDFNRSLAGTEYGNCAACGKPLTGPGWTSNGGRVCDQCAPEHADVHKDGKTAVVPTGVWELQVKIGEWLRQAVPAGDGRQSADEIRLDLITKIEAGDKYWDGRLIDTLPAHERDIFTLALRQGEEIIQSRIKSERRWDTPTLEEAADLVAVALAQGNQKVWCALLKKLRNYGYPPDSPLEVIQRHVAKWLVGSTNVDEAAVRARLKEWGIETAVSQVQVLTEVNHE